MSCSRASLPCALVLQFVLSGRHSFAKAATQRRLLPCACWGAPQVAEAMAQLMSDGLSCVCVLGDDTRRSVEDFLRNKRVSRVNILNLEVMGKA